MATRSHSLEYKGKNPFSPGQPVSKEFFTGRNIELELLNRYLYQVSLGKPQAVFLTGEYGMGKSSLAGIVKDIGERNYNLFGIHCFLGGAKTMDDVSQKVLQTVLSDEAFQPTVSEKIRSFLSKYIGKQSLFGFSLNLEEIKKDTPSLSKGFLPFLKNIFKELQPEKIKGIVLILDELNGIAKNSEFALFIKTIVDENSMQKEPLPLFLMLCGIAEKRKEMIKNHPPIDRIFQLIEIKTMNEPEREEFFAKSFESIGVKIDHDALLAVSKYSGGFPKAMHIIGDEIFWQNKDNSINLNDAVDGIISAAKRIGEQFIDEQVIKELNSKDYKSILKKIAKLSNSEDLFSKKSIQEELTETEKKKFSNFLQKMKKLHVLKQGDNTGEYFFSDRLTPLYIRMSNKIPNA